MTDPHDLQRFLDAQDRVYGQVIEELAQGEKATHWMWFIFPQLDGLGSSPLATRYAIRSLEEAAAYLAHPVLGARLRECTQLVLNVADRHVSEIFGDPDDLKFRSCMTLFARAAPGEKLFVDALERYFGGEPDPRTVEILRRESG